jgi:lipopolysaccharide/colanic/teichoic acid biosynthesis glycosyltransferase
MSQECGAFSSNGIDGGARRRLVAERHPGALYHAVKRAADVIVSVAVLFLLSPLLAVVAIVVCLDSKGPCLYRQKRTGRNGIRFVMYKFRTMHPGSEAAMQHLLHFNKFTAPKFKMNPDPRVTRVGRFLRAWSIDEIPNLINVLRGEMSLVGPRPTSWGTESYKDWHMARLSVLPGVTGLWQVLGREHMDLDEMVELDLEYIRRRSLAFDLWILLRTAGTVLTRKGAW